MDASATKPDGVRVVLAVSKEQVTCAPNIDSGEQPSDSDHDALRQYYSDYMGTAEESSG